MKVIGKDANILLLRDWSWPLFFLLAAVIATCLLMAWGCFRAGVTNGVVVMAVIAALLPVPVCSFVRWTSVRFDRTRGMIRSVEVGLLRLRIRRFPLQRLSGATTESHPARYNPAGHAGDPKWKRTRRPARTHRPVLLCADGTRVPLLDAYGEQARAGRAAAVNSRAQSPGAR